MMILPPKTFPFVTSRVRSQSFWTISPLIFSDNSHRLAENSSYKVFFHDILNLRFLQEVEFEILVLLNQRWGFTWVFLQNLLLQHLKLGKSFTIFINTFPLLFVIFTRSNFKIHIVVLFCFDHYLRAAYFFLIRATNLIWNSKLSST